MKTLADFKATLTAESPPGALPAPLLALWQKERLGWRHGVAQDIESTDGARIHAYYIARRDASNAATGIAAPEARGAFATSRKSGRIASALLLRKRITPGPVESAAAVVTSRAVGQRLPQ